METVLPVGEDVMKTHAEAVITAWMDTLRKPESSDSGNPHKTRNYHWAPPGAPKSLTQVRAGNPGPNKPLEESTRSLASPGDHL